MEAPETLAATAESLSRPTRRGHQQHGVPHGMYRGYRGMRRDAVYRARGDQGGFPSDLGGFSLNTRILTYLSYICGNTRIYGIFQRI